MVRFGSLPCDIMVHPRCVNSAMGFPGFPILGVFSVCSLFVLLGSFPILGEFSVLTWAYPFVTRMRCTGSVRCAHLIVVNFHVKIINRFSEDDFFVSRSVLQV